MSEYIYEVSKEMEIAGAHHLHLNYNSPCSNLHGHNWTITVYCRGTSKDENGMVVDFAKVKKAIHGKLDHQYINDVLSDINPTAENIGEWVMEEVNKLCTGDRHCYKVTIQESQGNIATVRIKDGLD